ncbi:SGNH hydrolase-type esterase domain-containing protein [Mrakia frigida]|uniref:SGNH/GDSL hydrolase family protein n=1 Tax=Mrakia frigida TaxID=29902 RepID=UPI003FCBF727
MSISLSKHKAIVLLGDSITEFSNVQHGLTTVLSDRYIRKLDVVNRGFSGYNTAMVLPIAKEIFAEAGKSGGLEIAAWTIFLGANDAVLFNTPSRQSIPLDAYVANLKEIISLVPSSVPVLVITPPIIQPHRWSAERGLAVDDRSEANTARYAQACRDLVAELGGKARLVDLWKAMETYRSDSSNNLDDLLLDGLHLTPEGYKLLNTLIFPILDELKLHPDDLEKTYPDWSNAIPEDTPPA